MPRAQNAEGRAWAGWAGCVWCGRDRDRDRGRDRERDGGRGDINRDLRWEEKERKEEAAKKKDDGKVEIKFAPRAVNPMLANDAPLPPPKEVKRMGEPVSIEEKLLQLKKSKEDAAKPVFLTKQQREQLALQRMEEQRKEREKAAEEARKMREQMQKDLRADREAERRGQRSQREIEREKERERERERERRAAAGEPEPEEPVISDKELAVVKARYLGVGKIKKKVVKVTDKHRFAFDWEVCVCVRACMCVCVCVCVCTYLHSHI